MGLSPIVIAVDSSFLMRYTGHKQRPFGDDVYHPWRWFSSLFQEGKRPAGPTEAGEFQGNPTNLAKFHEIPDRNGIIPTYY